MILSCSLLLSWCILTNLHGTAMSIIVKYGVEIVCMVCWVEMTCIDTYIKDFVYVSHLADQCVHVHFCRGLQPLFAVLRSLGLYYVV